MQHLLLGSEGIAPHTEGAQHEITVAGAAPAPVDVVLAVVVAVKDEGMAAGKRVGTRVEDGTSIQQVLLHQGIPVVDAVVREVEHRGIVTVTERPHALQLVVHIGAAARRAVVHLAGLAAIAHQQGNGIGLLLSVVAGIDVQHAVPVQGFGGQ